MNWFICALLTTLLWAGADVFYKKGAETEDKYSHLKTTMMVGLVMGIHAVLYMLINGISFNPKVMITYLPVSFFYIVSMAIGYAGLRYLELSVSSPIQNSSGAISAVIMVMFMGVGALELNTSSGLVNLAGVIVITLGVVGIAMIEKKEDDAGRIIEKADKKYVSGFVAIVFPILYCILDSLGTALDGVYLNEENPIITEDEALLAYEFTFLITALVCFCYLFFFKKQRFSISTEKNRGTAAIFETAGQFFYVFAMGGSKPYIAAPIIASYCVFSVVFSRFFLKEKLSKAKSAVVCVVLAGIVMLGVSEGLAEASPEDAQNAEIRVSEQLSEYTA